MKYFEFTIYTAKDLQRVEDGLKVHGVVFAESITDATAKLEEHYSDIEYIELEAINGFDEIGIFEEVCR